MKGSCELCGKEDDLRRVLIEDSILSVCEKCAKYGKDAGPIIPSSEVAQRLGKRKKYDYMDVFESVEEELVGNYAQLIRAARKRIGYTPEELGKKINEKKTVISKIESGTLKPDEDLVRKLEKTLNIKLMEKQRIGKVEGRRKGRGLTIGDLIRSENKK